MKALHLFFISITVGLVNAAAFAQELPARRDDQQNGKLVEASRYFLGKEHELLIPVNILGAVNRPGQFMVSSKTDLIALVAFAGGFQEEANLKEVKIMRKMGDHGKPNMIKVNLEQYYVIGDQQQSPPLMPDDTIIITNRKSLAAKTVSDIARTAAYIAQIVYIFVLIERN